MKRSVIARGAALLSLAALVGCDAPISAPSAAEPQDELARQVEALGFRGDMVQDFGTYVLVEGDIYITKDELRRAAPPRSGDPLGPRFQYRTNNLVGSPKVQQIRVDLSGLNSQPGWQSAAREALTHWSGIANSYVRMVEGSPADITVTTNCTSSGVAASASFPSGGNPGNVIYVNTCFGYSTSHAQKLHNMVHEFGHTLGFRHSNYTQLSESAGTVGAVHVAYTPTSGNDAGSVMNGGTALNSWAGFSYYDRVATVRLYPLAPPTGASISYPGGTPTMSWQPVAGASYYRIRLFQYSQWYSPEYGGHSTYFYTDVGTTTGTSFADTSRSYTGVSSCYYYYPSADEEEYRDYHYSIEAVFPNGFSSTLVGAAVATC